MFDKSQMFFIGMNYVLDNYTCAIRYVRLSVYGKVHEGLNNGFVRNMLHFFFFLWSCWTIGFI